MDTELKSTIRFGQTKSERSEPPDHVYSNERRHGDDNEDEEDNASISSTADEDAYLLKKSRHTKHQASPFYGSDRNVNSPVYENEDANYESMFSEPRTKQLCLRKISCPAAISKGLPTQHIIKLAKKCSHLGKLKKFILVSYCAICVILYGLYETASEKYTQTVISNESLTYLSCHSQHSNDASAYYRLKLNGPFITLEDLRRHEINSGKYVNLNVYGSDDMKKRLAKTWQLVIQLPNDAEK